MQRFVVTNFDSPVTFSETLALLESWGRQWVSVAVMREQDDERAQLVTFAAAVPTRARDFEDGSKSLAFYAGGHYTYLRLKEQDWAGAELKKRPNDRGAYTYTLTIRFETFRVEILSSWRSPPRRERFRRRLRRLELTPVTGQLNKHGALEWKSEMPSAEWMVDTELREQLRSDFGSASD